MSYLLTVCQYDNWPNSNGRCKWICMRLWRHLTEVSKQVFSLENREIAIIVIIMNFILPRLVARKHTQQQGTNYLQANDWNKRWIKRRRKQKEVRSLKVADGLTQKKPTYSMRAFYRSRRVEDLYFLLLIKLITVEFNKTNSSPLWNGHMSSFSNWH